jgi:peptide/nickel transport system substrate-binding protein
LLRVTVRTAALACLATCLTSAIAYAQREGASGVLVIATGADAPAPVPGVQPNATNYQITNLLFLRLAELGPTLSTIGDRGFVPMLAKSWTRRDSVTLVFELDSRALWHDGRPVTSRDVVYTYQQGKSSDLREATARITSVTADGPTRVVFTFSHPYAEQMYDATYHALILPEHLLASVPPDSLASSDFAKHPIGNGPFRWIRRVPDQLIELAAFDRFFLGAPKLDRVYFRVAREADARLNLLLSGDADVTESVSRAGSERIKGVPEFQLIPVPGPGVLYAVFNQKAKGDRSRPHPILADREVRRALIMALDRETMVSAVYGPYAAGTDGPVPQTFAWVDEPGHKVSRPDTAAARRLLARSGWTDHDHDGVLDKNGVPFELTINSPNTSPQRPMFAQQMQERWRLLGVKANIELLDFSVWIERRNAGQFDVDMAFGQLDPTPAGWRNSWSCATAGQPGRNVGSYCNPLIDSLLQQANGSKDVVAVYRRTSRSIVASAPAHSAPTCCGWDSANGAWRPAVSCPGTAPAETE